MADKYLNYDGVQRLVSKLKTYISNAVKVTGVKGNSENSYRTGNVNLTAANIGAFEQKQYERGTTEAGIRPLIDQARANRLAFLPPEQVIIEQTTDGGTTWTDAGISDTTKRGLFCEKSVNVSIPLLNGAKSKSCGIRVTITGMKYNVPDGTTETNKYNYWNSNYVSSVERYFNVREWWFWVSSNNDTIRPEIYCATGANPNNWVTVFNTDFRMTGWSGSDWIRAGGGKTFGGSVTQTGNYWNWRLIFWSDYADNKSDFISATKQVMQQIRCYGDSVWTVPNNFMARDHIYDWDTAMNVTFPAAVTATGNIITTNGTTSTKKLVVTGLENSTANASRNIWFSDNTTAGKPVVNSNFQYNPSTNILTVGNVNGKVNNHTVNSDVPANAVFTDTVTTATTIGSGNAVTAISASNGEITVTKGSTFLTSSQVQDMIDDAISSITNANEVEY